MSMHHFGSEKLPIREEKVSRCAGAESSLAKRMLERKNTSSFWAKSPHFEDFTFNRIPCFSASALASSPHANGSVDKFFSSHFKSKAFFLSKRVRRYTATRLGHAAEDSEISC